MVHRAVKIQADMQVAGWCKMQIVSH